MKKEEWKAIEGFEDYEVSNLGRVKSLPREICNSRRCYISKEKILKPNKTANGYLQIGLTFDKKRLTFYVHQLVSMSFLNHSPCGYKLVVNHKDFNKLNNNLNNLEIVTIRENGNKKHLKSTSKYTGVSWRKSSKKWISSILFNGKKIHLGYFNTEEEASKAYQNKLKQILK